MRVIDVWEGSEVGGRKLAGCLPVAGAVHTHIGPWKEGGPAVAAVMVTLYRLLMKCQPTPANRSKLSDCLSCFDG